MILNPPNKQQFKTFVGLSFSETNNSRKMHAAGEMYSYFRGWFSLDHGVHKIHNFPIQMKAISSI
jgi:hypothetical protein